MPALSRLQLAGIVRLQRKFKAAANTHGPLRCVLIHKEGEDFGLALSPPRSEDMPALTMTRGSLYSYRLHCRGSNGEEVLCKRATIGTGRNPYQELDEPVSRHEPFAGRDVYLLRNHKNEISSWPIDPKVLQADPNWQELSRRTEESWEEFRRIAGEAGRCFGVDDCGVLPGVARESLEAGDNGDCWLWIIFDLAWQKVRGSPLRAKRWVWYEAECEGVHFFAWELDLVREWELASRPGTGPDKAEQIKKLSYLKAWAERRPQFYYSHLDDLFSASVWAIDLLTLHKADATPVPGTSGATLPGQQALSDGEQVGEERAHGKAPPEEPSADSTLSPRKLAEVFGVSKEALRKRLERLRKEDYTCFVEVADRTSKEPQFLYYLGKVRHIIEDMKGKAASSETSSKRPARKNSP